VDGNIQKRVGRDMESFVITNSKIIIGLFGVLMVNGLTYSIYIAYRVSRNIGVKFVWLFFGICTGAYIIHEFFNFSIKSYFAIVVAFLSVLFIYKITKDVKKEIFVNQIRLKYPEIIVVTSLVFGPIIHYLIKNFGSIEDLEQTFLIIGITNPTVAVFSIYFNECYSKKEPRLHRIISFILIIIILLIGWLRILTSN